MDPVVCEAIWLPIASSVKLILRCDLLLMEVNWWAESKVLEVKRPPGSDSAIRSPARSYVNVEDSNPTEAKVLRINTKRCLESYRYKVETPFSSTTVRGNPPTVLWVVRLVCSRGSVVELRAPFTYLKLVVKPRGVVADVISPFAQV